MSFSTKAWPAPLTNRAKAEHVPIELGERGRVPCAEADVADADHLRRFLLGHGLPFPLANVEQLVTGVSQSLAK
jgi:hypothetical protein